MYIPAGVTILGRKLKDSDDVINEMHGRNITYP